MGKDKEDHEDEDHGNKTAKAVSPSNAAHGILTPPPGFDDQECLELLQTLRQRQSITSSKRQSATKQLDDMKNHIKKLRKETDELLRKQSSNLNSSKGKR